MKPQRDFITDHNPTSIYQALSSEACPDYVLESECLTQEKTASLSRTAFAVPDKRMFPVHNKAATFLSAAYFFGSGFDDPEVEENIKRAAESHGIESDLDNLYSLFTTTTPKQASDSSQPTYAVSVEFGPDDVQNFYPIHNALAIEASAEQIEKDANEGRLPLELKRQACLSLMKAASNNSQVDVETLPSGVVSMGTPRIPDFDKMKMAADLRGAICKLAEEEKSLLSDLVTGAEEEYTKTASIEERDAAMEKWAELILNFDRRNEITYGGYIEDPYKALFSGPSDQDIQKMARENVDVLGALVPRLAFSKIADESVRREFTEENAEQILAVKEAASRDGMEATGKLEGLSSGVQRELLQLLVSEA